MKRKRAGYESVLTASEKWTRLDGNPPVMVAGSSIWEISVNQVLSGKYRVRLSKPNVLYPRKTLEWFEVFALRRCGRAVNTAGLLRGLILLLPACLVMSGCNDWETSSASDPSGLPIHLEDRLDSARIESSALPTDLPPAVEWEFDQARLDWKVVTPFDPTLEPARLEPTENGLSVLRGEGDAGPAAIYIDLPDWNREDWASVLVRARTSDEVGTLSIGFNLRSSPGERENEQGPFLFMGDSVPIIKDGAEHTYLLRADWSWDWEGPWKQLGLLIGADEKARVEILAVKVIPKASLFAAESVGVTTIVKNDSYRRVLFTHTPSTIEFPVTVPPGGRLDVGLGVMRADHPVRFSVKVVSEDGTETTHLTESYADKDR